MKNCIHIPDDFIGFDPWGFCIPQPLVTSIHKVLIPHGMIKDRIKKLADDIFKALVEEEVESVSLLCVLKGAYRFYADLQESLSAVNANDSSKGHFHIIPEFIRLKSYENTSSQGEVKIMGIDDLEKIRGKTVVVVEDIIDTGRTMKKLLSTLDKYQPKKVIVVCLLRKRTPLSDGYKPDFVGFEIPDRFVIGYAFDYNEYFRDLMPLCVISEKGIEKFKE